MEESSRGGKSNVVEEGAGVARCIVVLKFRSGWLPAVTKEDAGVARCVVVLKFKPGTLHAFPPN